MTDQLTAGTGAFKKPGTDAVTSSGKRRPDHPGEIDSRLAENPRRWPALFAGLALGVGATVGAVTWMDRGSSADDAVVPSEAVELNTASVEQRDLIEEVEWSGKLAAGAVSSVPSPTSGTITAVAAPGATIGRGAAVARIDDQPVIALIGSTPMWRDLGVGDEGADVFQLETNLAALGFDATGAVTIDDDFTSATAAMVEAWQESLGVDETGSVAADDVVVISGESTVASSPSVGSSVQQGSDLATIETASRQLDVVGWHDAGDEALGTIDALAVIGTTIEHGTVLYTADGTDTLAVIDISPTTKVLLDAFATGDVEAIESVLAEIGFDPNGELTIDDEADLATAAAIVRWQGSVGLPATGSISASDYVVIPDDRVYEVDEVVASAGDQLGEGRLVMSLASPTLSLTADVAITEVDEFDVGDVVCVEQVDETTFTAVVTEVADTTTEGSDGGDPTVVVSFEVTTPPNGYVSGTVTIITESSRIDDAIVVPTRALVTLREGGFAVEKANADATTTLVGVELGTFDDGVVEVTSGDLSPGDLVVVPS